MEKTLFSSSRLEVDAVKQYHNDILAYVNHFKKDTNIFKSSKKEVQSKVLIFAINSSSL